MKMSRKGLFKTSFFPFKDPPRGSEYWIPTDPRFTHAQDLVEYINTSDEFSGQFSIGVAGNLFQKYILEQGNNRPLQAIRMVIPITRLAKKKNWSC